MKEADIHRSIMLELSPSSTLFRNNVGAYRKPDGSWLTYGLQNPGGADLIGWTDTEITQEMVGRKIAVFTAIEVKTPTGRISREQRLFLNAVLTAGGVAGEARSVREAENIVLQFMQQRYNM